MRTSGSTRCPDSPCNTCKRSVYPHRQRAHDQERRHITPERRISPRFPDEGLGFDRQHRHERDGPRQGRVVPGVRRYQGGPQHTAAATARPMRTARAMTGRPSQSRWSKVTTADLSRWSQPTKARSRSRISICHDPWDSMFTPSNTTLNLSSSGPAAVPCRHTAGSSGACHLESVEHDTSGHRCCGWRVCRCRYSDLPSRRIRRRRGACAR